MTDVVHSARTDDPRLRVRTNITKNTKGYVHETTVEIEFPYDPSPERMNRILSDYQSSADTACREEITRRRQLDEQEG